MEKVVRPNVLFFSVLMFLFIVVVSGCADKSNQVEDGLPSVSSMAEGNSDIELPSEMKWNSKDSMVIKTDSFRGGILHYSGRVEINSLKEFMITSMERNKWKHVGEASYKDVLLAFTKPNKTCMITLTEGIGGSLGNTHAVLYITVDVAAAKGLNPFGEPIQ